MKKNVIFSNRFRSARNELYELSEIISDISIRHMSEFDNTTFEALDDIRFYINQAARVFGNLDTYWRYKELDGEECNL